MKQIAIAIAAVSAVVSMTPAQGPTKVELKHVHMCCEGCAIEVLDILKKVPGVKDATCDQEANTARFVATDAKSAQNAVDALAANGFHGVTGTKDYAFKDDSGVKPGKVTSLMLTGIHNSCAGCISEFRNAIKNVAGVKGDSLKANATTCEITGDFDAAQVVEALNKAGFHVKVKK